MADRVLADYACSGWSGSDFTLAGRPVALLMRLGPNPVIVYESPGDAHACILLPDGADIPDGIHFVATLKTALACAHLYARCLSGSTQPVPTAWRSPV